MQMYKMIKKKLFFAKVYKKRLLPYGGGGDSELYGLLRNLYVFFYWRLPFSG